MFKLRKTLIVLEKSYHNHGPTAQKPLLVGGICGVVSNPYAGKYVNDLESGMEELKPLGFLLAKDLLDSMGCAVGDIESYGKGSIVGANGELEHGALWHAPGGYGMREVLGNTKAIVPSTKKVGALGVSIDIPLAHVNAAYVRSHFQSLQLQVPDAPRSDELVFCLAMATGPRIHARMGGLAADEITGKDGLR